MINYTKKYKTFASIAKVYKPMRFKYMGFNRKERLQRFVVLRPLIYIRRQMKAVMGWEITYFDLRASLTPEQRKKGDLIFLTHFDKSHAKDAQNVSRSERARYYWLKICYLPEIVHINSLMWDRDGEPIVDVPKDVQMYLVRWGYLLNASLVPGFIELLHGTEAHYAKVLAANVL
jgi:hypothetical protein